MESEVVGSGSSVVQRLELVTQLNMKEMRRVVMGYMNDSAGPPVMGSLSLVPRSRPAFRRLQYGETY